MARYLALGIAGATGVTLLIVANASALALGALLHRLVIVETGDRALARRAAWLIALVPPAVVLVMGYAEATAIALAVAAFLALRTRRWEWAAAAGLLAGLARPLGVLLVVPAALEAARGWSGVSRRDGISRVSAVVAPAVNPCTKANPLPEIGGADRACPAALHPVLRHPPASAPARTSRYCSLSTT